MRVFIYWNRKDNDSEKMFRFLKSGAWIQQLQKKHEVTKAFLYDRFNIDTCIIKDESENDIVLIEAMKKADLLIFFTHGDIDRIFKSSFRNREVYKEFTFVDCESSSLLSGKAVISICCLSARELGRHCVKEEGVPYYLGFEKAIRYNDVSNRNETLKAVMYKGYSNGFDNGFKLALDNNYNARQLANVLRLSLNKSITHEILSSDDHSLSKYSLGQQFYTDGIKSLICLGDGEEEVFSDGNHE